LGLGVIIGLDLITKPQAYIMIPILAIAVLTRWRWDEWKIWFRHLPIILAPIFLIAGWQEIPKLLGIGLSGYVATNIQYSGWENFNIYVKEYFHRALSAMIVWYWGVYKWLGVILPRTFWWTANRLLLLGIAVSGIRLIWQVWNRKFDFISRVTLFAFGANFIYVAALFWFDWQFYQQYGRSLGMQARYYMPLLILQMYVILHGITSIGWTQQIRECLRQGLIIFFLLLHLVGTYTLLRSYYDLISIRVLVDQLSQYKPFYAKGSWWYLWFSLYFIGVTASTWTALKSPPTVERKGQ